MGLKDQRLNALDRHLALIGFMGAGKSTLAEEVAARIGRRAVDADRLLEGRAQISIGAFFAQRGETEFRVAEASLARETFRQSPPAVVALGGGAVKTPEVQTALRKHAFTVLVDVDVDTAWERSKDTGRPNAQDESVFRRLYDERQPLYRGSTTSSARSNGSASWCPAPAPSRWSRTQR
jgi:shikimate kinase